MRILKICGQLAGNLRTVGGQFRAPNFVSRGSERGVGEKIRGPREINFGQNPHFRPTFFGARYQKKAVGSNANLLQSGAREILMVTKERPGGVVEEKNEGLVKGPATASRKSPLSRRSTGVNEKRKKKKETKADVMRTVM